MIDSCLVLALLASLALPTRAQSGAVVYSSDRTLSPITESVATGLRGVAALDPFLDDRVFIKVGESNTVNGNFLHCFAGGNVELDGRDALQPTVDHFLAGDAGGTDPFQRTSLAAGIGWGAWAPLAGNPPPLAQEVGATQPRLAVVMFGTNDIELGDIFGYCDNMLNLADWLLVRGVIPVLTGIPPRDDDLDADLWVPRYNAVVRGIAQARQVPFIDLHRDLASLSGHGLEPDGIHLDVYQLGGSARGCVLTADGLEHGFNVRNLVTLQTLDRVRRVLGGEAAPDATAPTQAGSGSLADPLIIDAEALPFTDLRNTATGGFRRIDHYDGCAAAQDESGPEFLYRLQVTRRMTVRAMVFDRGQVDVDVHLLNQAAAASGCLDRDDRFVVATLDPGIYHFVIDTFVSSGNEKAGEYLFVVVEEPGMVVDVDPVEALPGAFTARPAVPNPFVATTTLSFDLPAARHVDITLHGIDGRRVRQLTNQELGAGRHRVAWDGRDERGLRVAPGVYFVRIQAGGFTATHRLVRLE